MKAQLSVGETILAKLAIDNVLPDGAEVVIDGIESQRTNICKIIRELKISKKPKLTLETQNSLQANC